LRSKSLFNIPRRNFLKSDTVEYRHIIDEFQRVALAHKYLFHFFHNGSEPITSLKHEAAIVSIFLAKPMKAGSGARGDRDRYDSWIYR
jgi:hypothetical protein